VAGFLTVFVSSVETGTGHEPPKDKAAGKLRATHEGGTPVLPVEPNQEDRELGNAGDTERAGAL